MLLSEAKVASMWESKGDAARRRRGCVGARAVDFEGEEADGEAAKGNLLAVLLDLRGKLVLTFIVLLCRLVNDGRMLQAS
jgi:hypothetical protein